MKLENEKRSGVWILLVIILFFIFIKSVNSNTVDTITSTENSTQIHFCDASGCTDEGVYSINGTSGKEYYCYKHYKQMEEWTDMIVNYKGK